MTYYLKRLGPELLLLMLAIFAFVFVFAGPAGAEVVHTGPSHDTTRNVFLSIPVLTMIVGLVIPLLTNLITSSTASSATKAGLTLLLSALTAALSTVIDSGGTFDGVTFISAFLTVFLVAQGSNAATRNNVGAFLRAKVPGGIG